MKIDSYNNQNDANSSFKDIVPLIHEYAGCVRKFLQYLLAVGQHFRCLCFDLHSVSGLMGPQTHAYFY